MRERVAETFESGLTGSRVALLTPSVIALTPRGLSTVT